MIHLTKFIRLAAMSAFISGLAGLTAAAAEFNYDAVLPVYLKLDRTLLPEDIVDGYMEKYRPEVWQKYRYDEFELEEKRAETLKMMKEIISSTSIGNLFTIQTRFEFGDYNFESQKFDFQPFSGGLYFALDSCCTSLPRRIQVSFVNPGIVDGIAMPKDEARNFLNARKSSGGHVDRSVLAKVNIVLKDVPTRGELKSEIQSVHLYDRQGRTLIATITK